MIIAIIGLCLLIIALGIASYKLGEVNGLIKGLEWSENTWNEIVNEVTNGRSENT